MPTLALLMLIWTIHCNNQCEYPSGLGTLLIAHDFLGHSLLLFVDTEDKGISLALRNQQFDWGLSKLLIKLVGDGESVVYIGAHIGATALTIAKHMEINQHQKAHLYAFEPSQLNYILLTKSVYINGLEELVTVYKTAISDKQGQAEIAVRNENTAAAQIIENASTKRKADYRYQVPTHTVDSVLADQIFQELKFGLVVVTCNTFEIEALVGMRNLLKSNRKVAIVMDWKFGSNVHKNVDGLIGVLKLLQPTHQLFLIKKSQQTQKLENKQTNEYSFVTIKSLMEIIKIQEAWVLLIPASKVSLIM